MKYITCGEASKLLGITERRVQQMCKNGEIEGAFKQGRVWVIPDSDMCSPLLNENIDINYNCENKKPLPIGVTDFKKAVSDYYYVDKTLMIKDILDNKTEAMLFTRPRRFGKTLNMDMLKTFFEKTDEDTSVYFKDKLIWKCGEKYQDYQGKYPVIFLSFKDVKCKTYEETLEMISNLISFEFVRHSELEKSNKLNEYEKGLYKKFANSDASEVEYTISLQFLSLILKKHYNEKVIIIIDEYDVPIQRGYINNFYENIISFMRNFFSAGFKDNQNLTFGIMTGILRVSKESIFSGLNNIKVCSILDKKYSEYFGFTHDEVKEMLDYYNKSIKYREVSDWYDGYLFGEVKIFNPWSVINYIDNNCIAKPFWTSTSSNDIIGEVISFSTPKVINSLYKLLNRETITTFVDTNVIYPELHKDEYYIYSFLLVTGYLKIVKIYPQDNGSDICEVAIPNKEIIFVYEKEILDKNDYNSVAVSIQEAIFMQDEKKLQEAIEQFMLESISFYDGGSESFYHGMILGLCAVLSNRYYVKSNGEAGYGRFDIQLFPKIKSVPGFIFEFKHAKNENEDLEVLAMDALKQIDLKKYDTEMVSKKINRVTKIGIAFFGKKAVVKRS